MQTTISKRTHFQPPRRSLKTQIKFAYVGEIIRRLRYIPIIFWPQKANPRRIIIDRNFNDDSENSRFHYLATLTDPYNFFGALIAKPTCQHSAFRERNVRRIISLSSLRLYSSSHGYLFSPSVDKVEPYHSVSSK